MADHGQAYVDELADQLCTRHTALLATAENELQTFRGFKAIVARFINNQAIALDIRIGLAQDLRLPIPEK